MITTQEEITYSRN